MSQSFDSISYQKRLAAEVQHYEKVFKGRMFQDTPPIWDAVEAHFADAVEQVTKVRNLYQYVARHVGENRRVSVLGLGSGACGSELDGIAPLLKQQGCQMELTCLDINGAIIQQAEQEAKNRGVSFCGIQTDVNQVRLESESYDVVVAYAALHHFLDLTHVAMEINKALKDSGIFVTVDIPTRNGYMMWGETLELVNEVWRILPPQFKIDHTGFAEPKYVETYENIDYSLGSFECINSESILPALREHLQEIDYVPALSISRRFFDTKFGPNYDLRRPLDKSIFDFITNLDKYYIDSRILKPETFFGAYRKKT